MNNRLPLVIVVIVGVVGAIASPYIGHSASCFNDQGTPGKDVDSSALFIKNCASCHGKDGRAKTFKAKFNHARNLTDPDWQATITDEHMYESILKGKKRMTAFGKKLSKEEIAALVTYVRMLKR